MRKRTRYSKRGLTAAKQRVVLTPQTPNVARIVVPLTCDGCPLLASIQFAAHQNLQVFFSKAALHPGDSLQPVLMHGISLWQLRNFAFLFAEDHEVSLDSIFKLIKAPLD